MSAQILDGKVLAARLKERLIEEIRALKNIAKALNEIRKMRGITIIVSEQVLSFALDVADRLFVIEGGRLVYETSRNDTDVDRIKQYLSV